MLMTPMLKDGSDAALRHEMEVNVYGPLALTRAFAPILAKNGGGAIVNVLSVVSWLTVPFNATYCATKHAVRAISEGFRQEAGPKLRSTLISPGLVSTELPDHITHAQWVSDSKSAYEIAIGADVIARAIAYAIEQPSEVDVNEIVIRPTAQSS